MLSHLTANKTATRASDWGGVERGDFCDDPNAIPRIYYERAPKSIDRFVLLLPR